MTKKGEIMDSIKAKMGGVRGYLSLPQMEATNRTYVLLILVAYIFSVAIHAYWFKVYGGNEIFRFNGEYIITSPDGWFFGRGAKDALAGAVGIADGNMQVASLAKLAAVLKSVLPFLSLETIMFYSPVVIGSLSVIPLVLIGRLYSQPIFGLLSALFVVSLPGFYGRMGFGYFDDDLLTLQMPLWVLYATLLIAKTQNTKNLIFLGLTALFYQWWYPKSFSIIFALVIMLFIYTLLFDRRRFGLYLAVGVMLLGLSDMPLWMRLASVLFISYFYDTFALMSQKARVALLLSIIALFAMLGGFEPMVGPFKMYFFRSVADSGGGELGLHYFTSLKTVSESMSKPFAVLAQELSLKNEIFYIAIFGFLLSLFLSPSMMLTLPFLLLGLLSIDAGSRFVPYGNMAIGIYLAFVLSLLFYRFDSKGYISKAFAVAASVALLALSFEKTKTMQSPSALLTPEAAVLSEFGTRVQNKGTVFSWWDYGYPVMFYTGMQTISDGGRQGGDGSFVESLALTSNSQRMAANLLKSVANSGSFESLYKSSNASDPYQLTALMYNKEYKIQNSQKDVYLYIPLRMMNIVGTLQLFSNIDIRTGRPFTPRFFAYSQGYSESGGVIKVGGFVIDTNINIVTDESKNSVLLKAVVYTGDGAGNRVMIRDSDDSKPGLYVVINTAMRYGIVCDSQMFASNLVQMFALNNVDNEVFERVFDSPIAKIYKVK